MTVEDFAQYLVITHASLGGIALVFGALALTTKKGSRVHKRTGKLFLYAMITSVVISLVVAFMPGHESTFLFSIGVMSLYFVISGYRSLKFKHKDVSLIVDKVLAIMIAVTGVLMIIFPILNTGALNIILLIFGLLSLSFGIRDMLNFRDLKQLRKSYLKLHLGKMTGGYIAAVSAFFVVNRILPGIWNWFVPSIIGTVFIVYWLSKVDKRTNKA